MSNKTLLILSRSAQRKLVAHLKARVVIVGIAAGISRFYLVPVAAIKVKMTCSIAIERDPSCSKKAFEVHDGVLLMLTSSCLHYASMSTSDSSYSCRSQCPR